MQTGQEVVGDGEAQVVTGSGEERLVAWHSSLLTDNAGAAIGALICAEDITERRRRDNELQAHEAQMRLLTDSLPVLIARVDTEGRYQFNNAAYEDFFGIPREELKGMAVPEVIGHQVFDDCMPHIQDAMAGGSPVFELQFTNREGAVRDMQAQLVPVPASSTEPSGFYAVLTDISERHHLDSALGQSKKMEALGRLASGLARAFDDLLVGV